MSRTIVIDRRFRGPPTSGNGGYVAGLVANELGGSGCIVTLRKPPPLGVELRLEQDAAGVSLLHGDDLVASAASAPIEVEVPAPPGLDAAAAAEARYTGFCHHIFPGCFVCGPERRAGDGLRIFAGPLGDDAAGPVAATWTPDPSLGDEAGRLRPEFVWAALDCPGYFAVQERAGTAVLGRLGAVIHYPVPCGEPVVVTGWPIESQGRKHLAGTALHDRSGRPLAAATATWVSIQT